MSMRSPLVVLTFALFSIICLAQSDEFFHRSAKWARLSPSGGTLVSGRGNFRPGFNSASWRAALYEPSFALRKRSGPSVLPIDKSVWDHLNYY